MSIFEKEFNYLAMLKDQNNIGNDKLMICLWCGQPAQIIWIHGHGQCSLCGTNIDECCRGEHCNDVPPLDQVPDTDKPQ